MQAAVTCRHAHGDQGKSVIKTVYWAPTGCRAVWAAQPWIKEQEDGHKKEQDIAGL